MAQRDIILCRRFSLLILLLYHQNNHLVLTYAQRRQYLEEVQDRQVVQILEEDRDR